MSATKEKPKHTSEMWCLNCDPQAQAEPMTRKEASVHLKEKHGFGVVSGRKEAISFLDGDTYTNTYQWILQAEFPAKEGEVKLLEVASGPKQHA